MATDATGTPSSHWTIPKYLTSADAPSGKGFNAAIDFIDTLLFTKFPGFSSAITGTPSSTTFLRGDGSWQAIALGTTYRKITPKTVNTSTAATDLLNGEITIGAGAMGSTGVLRLTAWGDFVQNAAGSLSPPFFQITLGGTTFVNPGASALFDQSAVRYGWRVVCEIMNLTASSQIVHITYVIPATNVGTAGNNVFVTGEGKSFTAGQGIYVQGFNSGLAVNTASAQVLQLLSTNASASAAYETKLYGALVEII